MRIIPVAPEAILTGRLMTEGYRSVIARCRLTGSASAASEEPKSMSEHVHEMTDVRSCSTGGRNRRRSPFSGQDTLIGFNITRNSGNSGFSSLSALIVIGPMEHVAKPESSNFST